MGACREATRPRTTYFTAAGRSCLIPAARRPASHGPAALSSTASGKNAEQPTGALFISRRVRFCDLPAKTEARSVAGEHHQQP